MPWSEHHHNNSISRQKVLPPCVSVVSFLSLWGAQEAVGGLQSCVRRINQSPINIEQKDKSVNHQSEILLCDIHVRTKMSISGFRSSGEGFKSQLKFKLRAINSNQNEMTCCSLDGLALIWKLHNRYIFIIYDLLIDVKSRYRLVDHRLFDPSARSNPWCYFHRIYWVTMCLLLKMSPSTHCLTAYVKEARMCSWWNCRCLCPN